MWLPVAVFAQVNINIQMVPIEGDSQSEFCEKCVRAKTVSFEVSKAVSKGGGSETGGKATFGDLIVTKDSDIASPLIFLQTASGRHLNEVLILFSKTIVGEERIFTEIELENVIFSKFKTTGEGGDDALETVSLVYRMICIRTRAWEPDGSVGPDVEGCWDVERNDPF